MIAQFIDSHKTDFDSFDFHDSGFIVSKMNNTCVVQRFFGILKALLSIVVTVIVGQGDCFHGTTAEDLSIFRIAFESELFILPVLRCGEGSFGVGNGQIICLENGADILKEIVFSIGFIGRIQAGIIVKTFIGTQCTVTHGGDDKTDGFV